MIASALTTILCWGAPHGARGLMLQQDPQAELPARRPEEYQDSPLAWDVPGVDAARRQQLMGRADYEPASDLMFMELRKRLVSEMVQHYRNRPPTITWPTRMQRSFTEYLHGDPCEADILSTMGWNAGFGSGLNVLSAEVAVAAYFGATVAICIPPGAELNRKEYEVFDFPLPKCRNSSMCSDVRQYDSTGNVPWGYSVSFWGGCLDHTECDVWNHVPVKQPAQRFPGIDPEFHMYVRDVKHMTYQAIYKLRPDHQATVQDWRRRFGPPSSDVEPFVGVHIRGTDKFQEAVNTPIEAYANATLHFMDTWNIHSVYLATDDWLRGIEFKTLIMEAKPHCAFFMKSWEMIDGRHGGHVLFGQERDIFLAEVDILTDATTFVGTASSNVGRLVYFLRKPDEEAVFSVDEGNDFLSRHC